MLPLPQLAVFAAVLVSAAALDVRERRIPNWLTLGGAIAGAIFAFPQGGAGLRTALLGAALGLALGFVAFAVRFFGAGDAKLLMTVGSFLGPADLLRSALLMMVFGGVLAVIVAATRGTLWVTMSRAAAALRHLATFGQAGHWPERVATAETELPYGIAIALGGLVWAMMGGTA